MRALTCGQRVYEDDDDDPVLAATLSPAVGASGGAVTEQEIVSKFQDALRVGLTALDFFTVDTAPGGSRGDTGARDDDEDDETRIVPKPVLAKYVRQMNLFSREFCVSGPKAFSKGRRSVLV